MKWIYWTQKLQAIAQNGLTYSQDKFDILRYKQLQDITADIISNYTNHEHKVVQNYLTEETGYATPKIDVRGIVLKDGKFLFVREKTDNLWTIPGGWADIHETPRENVEREVLEESGYIVKAKRLLAIYDRSKHEHYPEYPHYVYKLFFLCEIVGGESKPSIETSEVAFFSLQNLPKISCSRVTIKQLHRMMELIYSNQTDFD